MPTAEITVQYRNDVKPGGKFGSIKSAEGDYYYASQPTINQFSKGEVCQIEYTESTGNDGKVWKRIQKKIAGAPQPQKVIPQVRAQQNPKDSKQIFVSMMLKSTTMPQDPLNVLKARGDQYKQLYEYLFGTEAQQNTGATLNDEIPDFTE